MNEEELAVSRSGYSPLRIWLAISVVFSCSLIACCMWSRGENIFFLLYLGLAGHYFCGLAGYLVFGHRIYRFLVPALIPLIAFFSAWITEGLNEWLIFACLVSISAGLAGLMLKSLKRGGIVRTENAEQHEEEFQFGIRDLFIASAAVAILLTILKSLNSTGQRFEIAVSGTAIGFVCVLNLWAVLGARITPWKWSFIFLSVILSGFALAWFISEDFWIAGSTLQLLNLVTLGCLRAEGFRIVCELPPDNSDTLIQESST